MPQMSKVELYAAIRRDHRGGMKIREIERKYNVSWRTVRKAVDSVWPEPRKQLPPRPTALDPYKSVIDGMLQADLDAPRKQRHTITRIFHRLVEGAGFEVNLAAARAYYELHGTLAAPRGAAVLDVPVGQWMSNVRRPGGLGKDPVRAGRRVTGRWTGSGATSASSSSWRRVRAWRPSVLG